MADELSWWELYKQELTDEFKRLAQFAKETAAATVNANTHWDNLVALWDRAKTDWDEFLEGRDLDEVRVNGLKLTSLVVVLRDAEEVLEKFRIGRLKQTVTDQYDRIKGAIAEMKTGELSRAGVGEDVGPMAELMGRIDDFLTQVEEILDALLSIAELFDIITTSQKEMEGKALTQGRPREKVPDPGFHYSRV